ncbi:MAG: BPL-N domain-containing protein [Ignavibacteria bacterium]|nr:BPL-N domain-containing protein [Ignavibacteria bacterium]
MVLNNVRFFIILIVALVTIVSCKKETPTASPPNPELNLTELKSIHVGLYIDKGAGGIDEIKSMLNQLGCFYSTINKDTILVSNLSSYDLILFPGGDMWVYKSHLSATGINKIKEYIQFGGGYIGICAGSYFAATKIVWRGWADEPRQYFTITGLGIFSGTADGPIDDFAPTYQVNNCLVNINRNHPITNDIPQQLDYLYSFGPKFIIADSSNVSVLGKSASGNNSVVLAVQYELGRVFLTGLHPEFDDDKSSWKMISNAILWCSHKL